MNQLEAKVREPMKTGDINAMLIRYFDMRAFNKGWPNRFKLKLSLEQMWKDLK